MAKAGKSVQWARDQWDIATQKILRLMHENGAWKYGSISHVWKRSVTGEVECFNVDEWMLYSGKFEGSEFDYRL